MLFKPNLRCLFIILTHICVNNKYPDHVVQVGANMDPVIRARLIEFLRAHRQCFAWSHEDTRDQSQYHRAQATCQPGPSACPVKEKKIRPRAEPSHQRRSLEATKFWFRLRSPLPGLASKCSSRKEEREMESLYRFLRLEQSMSEGLISSLAPLTGS